MDVLPYSLLLSWLADTLTTCVFMLSLLLYADR
ncbi:hypothetical protein HMPREF1487_08529 [Pseudomonas sp. HPB0071]|uniref:Uncharacterized protein n=1 Tax=Pseudomonas luteola TaxID=47886 RepID=A0A2X2D6Z8_PSELU|nr:hypothetical protein HMPREF1487_08529 [Pseudomonas sp. HPB0071]SHJ74472.1 hypothetical protein SAMN05216295_12711 [Pseudomonas zeshuii]SPZ13406.1 Uncharacterised protein [Pseudomonas luteola]